MQKENALYRAPTRLATQNQSSTVSVIDTSFTPLTMSSREIAALTGKRHADVMRDVRAQESAYCEVYGGERKFALSYYRTTQNKEAPEFQLTKSQALFVVSGYDPVVRARVQKRMEELEGDPALQLARKVIAQNGKLQLQHEYIEQTKKDVEFAQAVSSSKDGKKLGEFAKVVGVGPNKLFGYLRKKKILMEDRVREHSDTHNVPYQWAIDRKYFNVRRKPYSSATGRHRGHTTLITGKGEKWLTNLLIKDGLIESPLTQPNSDTAHQH